MFKLKQLYLFIRAIKVTVTNVAAVDNSKTSLGEAAAGLYLCRVSPTMCKLCNCYESLINNTVA